MRGLNGVNALEAEGPLLAPFEPALENAGLNAGCGGRAGSDGWACGVDDRGPEGGGYDMMRCVDWLGVLRLCSNVPRRDDGPRRREARQVRREPRWVV